MEKESRNNRELRYVNICDFFHGFSACGKFNNKPSPMEVGIGWVHPSRTGKDPTQGQRSQAGPRDATCIIHNATSILCNECTLENLKIE